MNDFSQHWRLERKFKKRKHLVSKHMDIDKNYSYPHVYHDVICEIFADNHKLELRDVKLLLYLFKHYKFTFDSIAMFPHKPRKWGVIMQKKTFGFLENKGWFRLYKNNSRSNPRIFEFTTFGKTEMTRLLRVLYLADPIGTSKFPVDKKFYDIPSYAKALVDINQTHEKLQREGDQIRTDE